MDKSVFIDTAYAIALASGKDIFHERAIQLAEEARRSGVRLVTTRGVVLEIGNALSRQRYRQAAIKLLTALETDSTVEIIPLSQPLYERAWHLYCERPDKEWGLTDCYSFVAMREFDIKQALTTDKHFEQAGFERLLK